MNDSTDNIIVDTATRIFRDLCEAATVNDAEKGVWPKALWDALEESGLTLAWVPDELGGAGAAIGCPGLKLNCQLLAVLIGDMTLKD